MGLPVSLYLHPHVILSDFQNIAISNGYVMVRYGDFNFQFSKDVEHSFMYLLAICISCVFGERIYQLHYITLA